MVRVKELLIQTNKSSRLYCAAEKFLIKNRQEKTEIFVRNFTNKEI